MLRLRAFVAGGMLLLAMGAQAKPIAATLKNEVDSRWSKPGDKVTLELKEPITLGGVSVPKGAQILGHVVGVKKQKHPSADHLGFEFDTVRLKDGRLVPVRVCMIDVQRPGWTDVRGSVYSPGPAYAPTYATQSQGDHSSGYVADLFVGDGFVTVLRGSTFLLKIQAQ